MISKSVILKINTLAAGSLVFATVSISPTFNLDPINLPKLWAISTFNFAILVLILFNPAILGNLKANPNIYVPLLFIFLLCLSTLLSDINSTQQFFGTFGRNTGFLAYSLLAILYIAIANIVDNGFKKLIIIAMGITLSINLIYGAIQANGWDIFDWVNPYNPVIGTLGNPNFIAAFLGIGIGFTLAYLVSKDVSIKYKVLLFILFAVAIYVILKSDAQQGIIISILSAGLVGYFKLRARTHNRFIRISYLTLGFIAILTGVLGVFQKGALATLLYKPSVTYRGDYWHAGLEMFKHNPWFGVGLDSYGDYYRAERTMEATLRRGPSAVSNAAHNVFIDIAATAGIFVLIAYLTIIFLGMRAAWKILKRNNKFDPFFTGIFVSWIGYLLQSIISINNLGLAIWGWALPATLVAINRWQSEIAISKNFKEIKLRTDFSGMHLVSGLVLGSVLGFLPFNADASLRFALETGDHNIIQNSVKKWPKDSTRIMYAVKVYEANQLPEYGFKLARIAASVSPRNFDALYYLYNSSSISSNEKRKILNRLKVLDPHNPELKNLG